MRSLCAVLLGAVFILGGCSESCCPPSAEKGKAQGGETRAARPSQLYAVTAKGELVTVAVGPTGAVGRAQRLGPRQRPQLGVAVRAHDVRVSASGRWVAWAESSVDYTGDPPVITAYGFSSTGGTITTTAFLLDRTSNKISEIPALGAPFGFAGEALVLNDPLEDDFTVVTPGRPNRTLREWSDTEVWMVGALAEGLVAIGLEGAEDRSRHRVDIVGYDDGSVRTLHRFPVGGWAQAGYNRGWVSGDGTRLAFERGDHTDYCGVGPSSALSIVDRRGSPIQREIAAPPRPPVPAGSEAQGMRLQNLWFDGPDSSLALWMSCVYAQGLNGERPYSAIYRLNAAKWSLVQEDAIAAVPFGSGGLVLQPGRIRLADGEGGPAVFPEPSGNAVLTVNGRTVELSFSGVEFHVAR